jgi:hypothetical protein
VTREGIRQIEAKALKKRKHPAFDRANGTAADFGSRGAIDAVLNIAPIDRETRPCRWHGDGLIETGWTEVRHGCYLRRQARSFLSQRQQGSR